MAMRAKSVIYPELSIFYEIALVNRKSNSNSVL